MVDEFELVQCYYDVVVQCVGICEFVDDGVIDFDYVLLLLVLVFLEKDFVFVVFLEVDVCVFVEFDFEYMVIWLVFDFIDWQVICKVGIEIWVL